MLIPVRCFTCGNLIADKMEKYKNAINDDVQPGEAMDTLGIKRYCCRRMLLTAVETIHQIVPFYEAMYKNNEAIRKNIL